MNFSVKTNISWKEGTHEGTFLSFSILDFNYIESRCHTVGTATRSKAAISNALAAARVDR